MAATDGGQSHHLCVLIHGLWGNPKHLDHVANTLRDEYPEAPLHVLLVKTNAGNFTYDGIELGAERVTKEIEDEIDQLEKAGKAVAKLSIVGYSLGGLVARYTVGLLYSKGWFDNLEPVNFTTFATPHLGTRSPLLSWRSQFLNSFGSRTLSVSGRQLWAIDSFRDTGRPLLSLLADPDSVFIRALSSFKHKSLYANIVNDRSVPYYTSHISRTDPFSDLTAVDIHYLPDTDDTLLDPNNLVTPKSNQLTTYEYISSLPQSVVKAAPFYLFFTVVFPIASVVFLVNSGIQSFYSAQRIRLHEEGKAGIGVGAYRLPLIVEGLQRRAEGAVTEAGATHEQYLTRGEAENRGAKTSNTLPSGTDTPLSSSSSLSDPTTYSTSDPEKQEQAADAVVTDEAGFPVLALTPQQFEMIDSLDRVGFKKYAVHIKHARHSHAAIVVRIQRESFDEGRRVVKHWAENFAV